MHVHEQRGLRCSSQWGQQMLLSERVYCVAVIFKITEQVEQLICIKFCIKLEQPAMEIIWMIQKDAGMGNW